MLKKFMIYLSYHGLEKMFTFSQAIPWKGKQSLLLEDILCFCDKERKKPQQKRGHLPKNSSKRHELCPSFHCDFVK
jgi:hypothetical protein